MKREGSADPRISVLDAVAHELRTPLTVILGHQELLVEGLYGEMEERCREVIGRIGDSAVQLLHLMEGVLDLTRLSLEGLELALEDVPAGELLEVAGTHCTAMAAERGASIEVAYPHDPPTLHTDRRRCERVLLLALSAGIRASPGASLRLGAATAGEGLQVWLDGCTLPEGAAELHHVHEELRQPDARPAPRAGRARGKSGRAARGDSGESVQLPALEELLALLRHAGVGPSLEPVGDRGVPGGSSWLRLTIARTLARALGGEVRLERAYTRGRDEEADAASGPNVPGGTRAPAAGDRVWIGLVGRAAAPPD